MSLSVYTWLSSYTAVQKAGWQINSLKWDMIEWDVCVEITGRASRYV